MNKKCTKRKKYKANGITFIRIVLFPNLDLVLGYGRGGRHGEPGQATTKVWHQPSTRCSHSQHIGLLDN